MADVRLIQIGTFADPHASPLQAVRIDWLLTPLGELDDTEQLASAAIIAVGTDRRAADDDELPNPDDDDRRGWWGDLDAKLIWQGWPIGSRLWLLSREKITDANARRGATLIRVRNYVREALQPFVDNKIASRLDVTAVRTDRDTITATARLYRGPKTAIQLEFQDLWSEIEA